MNWKPASETPKDGRDSTSATHALCWCESNLCVKGMFYEGRWQLDWSGSFDNDDEVVRWWCEIVPPEGIQWDYEKGRWIEEAKLAEQVRNYASDKLIEVLEQ